MFQQYLFLRWRGYFLQLPDRFEDLLFDVFHVVLFRGFDSEDWNPGIGKCEILE